MVKFFLLVTFSVFAGLMGVFLGGYFYPIFLSYGFFPESVSSGNNYFNTPEFGNWAMWFGAVSTFVAAIGTVGTFAFLAYDHIKNRKFNQELKKREMETLQFQQYQVHKELFKELLLDLNNHPDMKFKFRDINTLYKKVFPNNRIGNCIYHMSNTESVFAQDAVSFLNTMIEDLNDLNRPDCKRFFSDLDELMTMCNLELNEHGFGDVCYHEKKVINIYHITEVINQLRSIVASILEFIGISSSVLPLPMNKKLLGTQQVSFLIALSQVHNLKMSGADIEYLYILAFGIRLRSDMEALGVESVNRYTDDVYNLLSNAHEMRQHIAQNYMIGIYFDAIAEDYYSLKKVDENARCVVGLAPLLESFSNSNGLVFEAKAFN
ncbi:hypothetical protein ACOIVT_004534 [Vibrio parahaemolyticus]|nr:hypothetical protein [Vibrio parahaemolyticus]